MLKTWFNKRRQQKMVQSENAFDVFDGYLNVLKNNVQGEEYEMQYEFLKVSYFIISTEFAEPSNQFNQTVTPYFNLPKLEHHQNCSETSQPDVCMHKLCYKDKTLSWSAKSTPISDELEVFMMNKLVNGDIEIRLETATNEQSDRCWFALSHNIWQQLEDKYGAEFVRLSFKPLPDEFWEPTYNYELIEDSDKLVSSKK